MPIITVSPSADPTNEHKILEVNGRPFPYVFDEDLVSNIPNLKLRDDDVLLCGYMRSGTHWNFEIISMLLNGIVETIPHRKESLHLEQASQDKLDHFPSPRVLSSHLLFENLPREILDRKTKIVYLIRDPRDALSSWYTCIKKINLSYNEQWNITLPDWLELSTSGKLEWGSWFENIASWERALQEHTDHPILLVFYEELLREPLKEITRIKDFLGVPRDEHFCKRVVEKTKFEKMKNDKEKYTEKFAGNAVHYHKAVIGNWRTMFTVALSEWFDDLYEEQMAESVFRKRYSHSEMS
ncbi:sulfotransferase 1C2A-like isoform X1 [Haliotis rufescens]|uniref:sulfotransferase 1C2A-like isoform X1 n=1 Tax=Haliotis rufescens TaxID=6454 RepID=UPI001EAFC002|nr:sulfotransferase 1C2A-like isoform X1 [Haliotis rufescens]